MKLKLFIEYDGTQYSGWQKQNNAKTVQGSLIKAVETAFSKPKGSSKLIDLQGSGRTDSGVHAIGQIAHIECETMIAPHILKMKINDELPSDINILDIEKADNRFHARHSAESRQYLYRISRRRTAFDKKYVWWIKDKLNLKLMQEVTGLFLGMHDFKSFSEPDKEDKSTKCLIELFEITEEDDLILIRIKASHFLWKMVRRIVGTLVEAGKGNIDKKEISIFLETHSQKPAQFTAPPSGLFLEKVYYKK
ncbi:MAG: tRNA pseudouridine(38-40) synthase TruA [Ignavibacteria bacterium]|nr:tRNA pseudouridine(38-40) synthase TruA [Ignavibacteria bacterium]